MAQKPLYHEIEEDWAEGAALLDSSQLGYGRGCVGFPASPDCNSGVAVYVFYDLQDRLWASQAFHKT